MFGFTPILLFFKEFTAVFGHQFSGIYSRLQLEEKERKAKERAASAPALPGPAEGTTNAMTREEFKANLKVPATKAAAAKYSQSEDESDDDDEEHTFVKKAP